MDSSDSNLTSLITTTPNFNCSLDSQSDVEMEMLGVKSEEESFKVPCVICGTPVQEKCKNWKQLNVEDKEEVENDKIFQWFLLKFMAQRQRYGNHNRKVDRFDDLLKNKSLGWDGHGGQSSPLPFCDECKVKVVGLMEINTKEKSGKKEIADKMQEVKKMMREYEAEFVDCGIYDKDKRYHRVRRFILKVQPVNRKKLKIRKANRFSIQDKLWEEKVVVKEEAEDVQDWRWEDDQPEIKVKEENYSEEDEEMVDEDPLGPDAGAPQENDNLDENEYHRNCLLCYKAISKRESAMAPVLTNDLVEHNLNSVFILRKMLGVPKGTLAGYLKNFGCPGKWVEYCKSCLGLVDSALRIQKEISRLEDKLRRCQEKMVVKIKSTFKKKNVKRRKNWEITRVTEESRQFVAKPVKKVTRVFRDDDEEDDDGPLEPPQPSSWTTSDNLDPSYDDDNAGRLQEEKWKPSSIITKKAKLSPVDQLKENRMNKFVNILKGGSYTCPLCPKTKHRQGTMSLAKFYSHMIFHAQRPFKCSTCNLYWSGAAELKTNPFCKNPPSNGHLCSEASLVKISLEGFSPGQIWGCKWCPDKFKVEALRDSHEDSEHSTLKSQLKMKYKCLSCNGAYRSFREWLLHRVLEHPAVAGISCLYCDYTAVIRTKEEIEILNGNKMSDHVNSVHSASCRKRDECLVPEVCDFCGVTCKVGTDKMKRHVKTVHKLTAGLSTYSCPCCWARYDHMIQLRWHIMLEHEQGSQSQVKPDDKDVGELESPESSARDLHPSNDDDGIMAAVKKPKPCQTPKNKFEKILRIGSYTCPSCPTLMGKMSLAKFCSHLIFHKQRPFQCTVCQLYWSGAKELEKNPFTNEPPSNGHLCTEATLVRVPNEGIFNPGKIWECEWCPEKFEYESARDVHEDDDHAIQKSELEMKHKCLSCNSAAYRSFREWSLHRALEHPETAAISCLYCDYTTIIQTTEGIDIPNWVQIKDHLRKVHYSPICSGKDLRYLFVAPETCDFCGVSCRGYSEKLKRHVKNTHKLTTGTSTYSCPCCWSRFGELGKLRKHITEEHEQDLVESPVVVQLEDNLLELVQLEEEICSPSDDLGDDDDPIPISEDDEDDEDEALSRSPAKKAKLSGRDEICVYSGDEFVKILKEGKYTCHLCPHFKGTMSLAYFHSHLIFHARRPFKCLTCNLYWSGPDELEKNPFKEHTSLPNGHLCSAVDLVRVHYEGIFKPGKIWECEWCPEKFDLEKDRDMHEDEEHSLLKIHLKMEYKCISCNSSGAYRSFQEWLLHRVLEHPEVAGISCLYCDYTAVIPTKDGIDVLNTLKMRTHANSMHPQSCKGVQAFRTPEACDFCGLPCKGCSDKLGRHLKIVHKLSNGQSTYNCPCCWSRFGQVQEFRTHIMKEHSLSGGGGLGVRRKKKYKKRFQVICDVCGETVSASGSGKSDMANHKLVKHGIEPEGEEFNGVNKILTCEKGEECGGFRTLYKWVMRSHMMTKHGAERTWKCEECGKGFVDSGKLARHKPVHNKGVRPYQCEICGNSFAVKNYLYIHMRLSHLNRPFASTNKKRVKKVGTSDDGSK